MQAASADDGAAAPGEECEHQRAGRSGWQCAPGAVNSWLPGSRTAAGGGRRQGIDGQDFSYTITYPEMEHLAKPLHHAMKTALFPLFFLPSCKILNEDSKKSPIKWTLCMGSQWKLPYFIGYGTQCWSTTITFCHILSQIATVVPSPASVLATVLHKIYLFFSNVAK